MITNFQKGCQDNLTEKKSFQKLVLEKLGIHMQKNEVGSSRGQTKRNGGAADASRNWVEPRAASGLPSALA